MRDDLGPKKRERGKKTKQRRTGENLRRLRKQLKQKTTAREQKRRLDVWEKISQHTKVVWGEKKNKETRNRSCGVGHRAPGAK